MEYFLCIGPDKYPRTSTPATKMLFPPSIIIAHVRLFYSIIIIYLQVSKTEGLVTNKYLARDAFRECPRKIVQHTQKYASIYVHKFIYFLVYSTKLS